MKKNKRRSKTQTLPQTRPQPAGSDIIYPASNRGGTITSTLAQMKAHKGPIPSPETFKGYAEIREDLPSLIIEEWLKEGDFRRTATKSHLRQNAAKIAIVAIFVLGLLMLSGWLAYVGEYKLAVAVLVSPLIVKIFGILTEKAK